MTTQIIWKPWKIILIPWEIIWKPYQIIWTPYKIISFRPWGPGPGPGPGGFMRGGLHPKSWKPSHLHNTWIIREKTGHMQISATHFSSRLHIRSHINADIRSHFNVCIRKNLLTFVVIWISKFVVILMPTFVQWVSNRYPLPTGQL